MTLDTFEQSLLTELRWHVAEAAPPATTRRSRRWGWAAVPVGAAAAVAVGVTLTQSPAAYAVSEDSSGDVTVTIHRLDDAAGLEKALAAHGIEADVDYDASAAPPAHGGRSVTARDDSGAGRHLSNDGPTRPCGGPTRARLSQDAFSLTVPATWADSGAVLHLTTSGSVSDGVAGLQIRWTGHLPKGC